MGALFVDKGPEFLQAIKNSIGTALAHSMESYLGRTSRIYFDNVTLTLHNVTLRS